MLHQSSPRVNLKFNSTNLWARRMPKNKRLPDELLAKLHGKGTMSEILDIERARLLKQSEQDMRRQLGRSESPGLGGHAEDSAVTPAPAPQPSLQPIATAVISAGSELERELTVHRPVNARIENAATDHHAPTVMPITTPIINNMYEVATYQPPTS